MRHSIAERADVRIGQTLDRVEAHIDYRPFRIASWGLATATVFGAAAAGLGMVAAGAGAYLAVRAAVRANQRDRATEYVREIDVTEH